LQNLKVTQQFLKQLTPVKAATLMSKLSEELDVISKSTNGGDEIDNTNSGDNGAVSDHSTVFVESEHNITSESAVTEVEPDEYFGISVVDASIQTESVPSFDPVVTELCDEALGFNFVTLQALDNVAACHDRIRNIFDPALVRNDLVLSDVPEPLHRDRDRDIPKQENELIHCDAIAHARNLTANVHWVKCDTSYTSFGPGGQQEHNDDWSSSNCFVATVVIHDNTHLFFLECASNATVDALCSSIHNYIVQHVRSFLFALEIPDSFEDELISNLDSESIAFRITELVSHDGCLHPVGEPCCCEDTDDSTCD
jgi:hypothetical protein